jgi:hypothetical protein
MAPPSATKGSSTSRREGSGEFAGDKILRRSQASGFPGWKKYEKKLQCKLGEELVAL